MAHLQDPGTVTNTQTIPLDSNRDDKSLGPAGKIRHTANVPGSTDNDVASWLAHLAQTEPQDAYARLSAFAALALAERNRIGLNALEDVSIASWGDADDDDVAAGFGFGLDPTQREAYEDITWDGAHTHQGNQAPLLYLSVPKGFRPEWCRVEATRSGSVAGHWPFAGQYWKPQPLAGLM